MSTLALPEGPGSPQVPGAPGAPFPPLLQFGLAFVAGVAIDELIGGAREWSDPVAVLGVVLAAAGLAVFAWGMWTFARARTGILLQKPATQVVTHGPYRWSRNPMYVGCVLIYAGAALAFHTPWALLVLPLVMALIDRTVIAREERYMARTFGAPYRAYCARVGRWI